MRVFVRYDTPDEHSITRRDKYEHSGLEDHPDVEPPPELEIPDWCEYLWEIYHEISDGVERIVDGVCIPIPWSEFLAWQTLTERVVTPREYAILRSIDNAFCSETNVELEAYRERIKPTPPGNTQNG